MYSVFQTGKLIVQIQYIVFCVVPRMGTANYINRHRHSICITSTASHMYMFAVVHLQHGPYRRNSPQVEIQRQKKRRNVLPKRKKVAIKIGIVMKVGMIWV